MEYQAGNVVRVRLPHDESSGIPCLLIEPLPMSMDTGDVWWKVIYNGELKDVHQDYFRGEVLSDLRNR